MAYDAEGYEPSPQPQYIWWQCTITVVKPSGRWFGIRAHLIDAWKMLWAPAVISGIDWENPPNG